MSDYQDPNEERLAALEQRFLVALGAKDAGDLDTAEDELRAILKIEPRLPEPRIELARILLDTNRLEEAEEQGREGLRLLEAGGQWNEDLEENVVQAIANALVAEILRRRADEDDVIFGDPAEFKAMIAESQAKFAKAAALDPADEYASYHAFFLGARGHGGKEPVDVD